MTTYDIEQLLGVPNSTLSDWDRSDKRSRLSKLLRAIDKKSVNKLIQIQDAKPKISPKTRKLKLNKGLFTKDLLWSRENGSEIRVDDLILIYLNTPDQTDTRQLMRLFGHERLLKVLKKHKAQMHDKDHQEALEQIAFADSPQTYYVTHILPDIQTILERPKERHLLRLLETYNTDELINMAKAYHTDYPAMFTLKKILSSIA